MHVYWLCSPYPACSDYVSRSSVGHACEDIQVNQYQVKGWEVEMNSSIYVFTRHISWQTSGHCTVYHIRALQPTTSRKPISSSHCIPTLEPNPGGKAPWEGHRAHSRAPHPSLHGSNAGGVGSWLPSAGTTLLPPPGTDVSIIAQVPPSPSHLYNIFTILQLFCCYLHWNNLGRKW